MNDGLLSRFASVFDSTVEFQLLLREEYTERRYKHLWQGWRQRLRGLYRTEVHWDSNGEDDWSWEETHFCGWRELFFPVNKRYRSVPVGETVIATPTVTRPGRVEFGQLSFTISEFGRETGVCEGIRGFSPSGEHLMDISMNIIYVRPRDTVIVAPAMTLS